MILYFGEHRELSRNTYIRKKLSMILPFFRHTRKIFILFEPILKKSEKLTTYWSCCFGRSVPNSLILSLILNLRRRSTESKNVVAKLYYSNLIMIILLYFKMIDYHLYQKIDLLILWLSFFWRSFWTARRSSSESGSSFTETWNLESKLSFFYHWWNIFDNICYRHTYMKYTIRA